MAPWSLLFATGDVGGTEEDFFWQMPDGTLLPRTFVDAARDPATGQITDAALFLDPLCGSTTPVCFRPMGGSQVRFRTDGPTGPRTTDCAVISTGFGNLPVATLCPNPTGDGLEESGPLSRAMSGPRLSGGIIRLAWQVSGTWDLNADAWMDVLVVNGRDAVAYPAMPSYAYLQTPRCFEEACTRFEHHDLPLPPGHHHAAVWTPVQRGDGSWTILGILNSDVTADADARVRAFTWDTTNGARWVALQVGENHDLSATGAVVRATFTSPTGRVLSATEEVLLSVASTWGLPAANPPVVLGVPRAADHARFEIDFPGCRPTVVVEGADFNRPWTVEIPDCP